jgi:prophage regulatory protein
MAEISLQRSPVVCKRLGRGRATLHQDVHDGLLTPAITIGSRWSAWPSDEIDQIARARIAGWSNDDLRALVKELVARRKTAAPGRIASRGDDEPAFVT